MRNVVILGMHRSGTSMVAGALVAAGIRAGEDAELLEDQEDNPHGFWERRDVVELNDRSLAACDGSWYDPPASLAAAETLVAADVRSILARMPAEGSWQIKDPRLAITWPLWRDSLGDCVLLFVYRDPFSVAASLQRRNGFPLSLGLALWEHYNRRILEALQERDAICLSFASVSAAPAPAINDLLGRLTKLGVACAGEVGASVFDASLGHSGRGDRDLVEELLTPSQRALAAYCEALCEGIQTPAWPQEDPTLAARLRDLSAALAPLARVHETRFELEESVRLCAERTEERDDTLQQLRSLEDEHFDLKDEHHALAEAHHAEVARHEKLQRQHQVALAEHSAERAFLKEKIESLFIELGTNYGRLLSFEQSRLASLWRFTARLYKAVRFRRGQTNSYDDVLADARRHFEKHGIPLPGETETEPKPMGKAAMLRDVVSYVVRNPAGSARSFSLPRLKRAAEVFMKSSPEDLGVWIDSRFPARESEEELNLKYPLDETLDELRLCFPAVEAPRVSIVVPVYNEYRVTVRCLASILEHSGDVPYEVIVGDDCSTDLTASMAERLENVRIVRGEQNRGFLLNCNEAAEHARGDYILFLNNDTAVCPGWLEPLLETVDRDDSIGVVGSKLLFPDGRLQEAGGIVWRDASGWNYGRMDDPDKPEYNYVKEVDYISGACLMIRRALWRELGGFDVHFCPAYYEDTDLAFRVRKAGYRVVYQPASAVYHFEGVSHGTDLSSGMKKHQVDNQSKFREKWRQELDAFHFPNAEHVFWARDRSRDRRCVLFIDHYVPHFDKDAGSRSTFMYVQLMLELGYRVLFLGANYFPHQPYTRTLQGMGVEVLVGEAMARGQDRWLRDNAPYIDCIYLHRPHVAEQFMTSLGRMNPRPRIIFFGHDLHYLRIHREYQLLGDEQLRKTAEKWRRREYAVFDQVDKVYYPSQVEVDEIRSQRPELDLRAIPLYAFEEAEAASYDFSSTRDILFVGGFSHPPNVDGICWFVEEVLPRVSSAQPDVRLHVVGSNPTDTVQDLQSEQVVVYGYLSDEELDALYRRVRLVVVPLRFGAGVKGKVLEAVRKNLPLVTTSVGAEGIPEAESVMTIADDAGQFAEQVHRLYAGDAAMLAKLEAYPGWLRRNFSKANASEIILEDFGPPVRNKDGRVIAETAQAHAGAQV